MTTARLVYTCEPHPQYPEAARKCRYICDVCKKTIIELDVLKERPDSEIYVVRDFNTCDHFDVVVSSMICCEVALHRAGPRDYCEDEVAFLGRDVQVINSYDKLVELLRRAVVTVPTQSYTFIVVYRQ